MMNRRSFLLSAAPVLATARQSLRAARGERLVFFGTYTRKLSKGIYVSRFNPADGKLSEPELAAELTNPSWVALHPKRRALYAVAETSNYQGQKTGAVAAFASDPVTGKLTKLNELPSHGTSPCHVTVDRSGRCAVVANYGTGSVACYPLKSDGSLGEASAVIQHTGSGPNPSRQQGPHAHQAVVSLDNRFVLIPDLGLDKVMIYRLDPAKGTLTPNDPPFASTPPGAGPRHMAFHPKGRYAYVICELTSVITAYSYDASRGAFTQLTAVSTLPPDFSGRNSTAEIEVHPNGRFLYGSNRGHDSIAVFSIDASTGTLSLVEHVSTQGKTPRNFKIDPSGNFLLAANQDTDNVLVFRIDPSTGRLSPTGQTVQVGAPVCIEFL
ncbi:MAG: lactonase family protein [Bryobacteraceae bacterium]|nr:lactonase family protein [Bryobacteraceae bacterium]